MFITRLHRVPTLRDRFDYLSSTHSPRSAGRRCPLQRFESALGAQRLRNRGQICETKRGNAPLDIRAMPLITLPRRVCFEYQYHWNTNDYLDFGLFLFSWNTFVCSSRHEDFAELYYSFISGRRYIGPAFIYFKGPFCSWKGTLQIYKNRAQKVRRAS